MENTEKDTKGDSLKWYKLLSSGFWDIVESRVKEMEDANNRKILQLSRTPSVDTGIEIQCLASQTEALKKLLRYATTESAKVKKGEQDGRTDSKPF